VSPSDLRIGACMPGPLRWVGPPGPQPAASGAGRGEAQRSRLDLIRLNSAAVRQRAESCVASYSRHVQVREVPANGGGVGLGAGLRVAAMRTP
jgi:hypothetical protein